MRHRLIQEGYGFTIVSWLAGVAGLIIILLIHLS